MFISNSEENLKSIVPISKVKSKAYHWTSRILHEYKVWFGVWWKKCPVTIQTDKIPPSDRPWAPARGWVKRCTTYSDSSCRTAGTSLLTEPPSSRARSTPRPAPATTKSSVSTSLWTPRGCTSWIWKPRWKKIVSYLPLNVSGNGQWECLDRCSVSHPQVLLISLEYGTFLWQLGHADQYVQIHSGNNKMNFIVHTKQVPAGYWCI